MNKQKLQTKIPPHHLYCPICGDKARLCEFLNNGEYMNQAIAHKHCDKCGANWIVKYNLEPTVISDLKIYSEYEDISL